MDTAHGDDAQALRRVLRRLLEAELAVASAWGTSDFQVAVQERVLAWREAWRALGVEQPPPPPQL